MTANAAGRPLARCLSGSTTDHDNFVVAFPHAGGSGTYFRSWAALLPPRVGLLAVTYSGRAHRADEPLPSDIALVADEVASALAAVGGRHVYFGHSLGALVAHQVALRVAPPPVALVVSSCTSPQVPQPDAGQGRDDADLWAELVELNGIPSELQQSVQVRDLTIPVLRADYRVTASAAVAPTRVLGLPIVAFLGDADPTVVPDDMAGWADLTTHRSPLQYLPGDHFSFNQARVRVLDECVSWLTDQNLSP